MTSCKDSKRGRLVQSMIVPHGNMLRLPQSDAAVCQSLTLSKSIDRMPVCSFTAVVLVILTPPETCNVGLRLSPLHHGLPYYSQISFLLMTIPALLAVPVVRARRGNLYTKKSQRKIVTTQQSVVLYPRYAFPCLLFLGTHPGRSC